MRKTGDTSARPKEDCEPWGPKSMTQKNGPKKNICVIDFCPHGSQPRTHHGTPLAVAAAGREHAIGCCGERAQPRHAGSAGTGDPDEVLVAQPGRATESGAPEMRRERVVLLLDRCRALVALPERPWRPWRHVRAARRVARAASGQPGQLLERHQTTLRTVARLAQPTQLELLDHGRMPITAARVDVLQRAAQDRHARVDAEREDCSDPQELGEQPLPSAELRGGDRVRVDEQLVRPRPTSGVALLLHGELRLAFPPRRDRRNGRSTFPRRVHVPLVRDALLKDADDLLVQCSSFRRACVVRRDALREARAGAARPHEEHAGRLKRVMGDHDGAVEFGIEHPARKILVGVAISRRGAGGRLDRSADAGQVGIEVADVQLKQKGALPVRHGRLHHAEGHQVQPSKPVKISWGRARGSSLEGSNFPNEGGEFRRFPS